MDELPLGPTGKIARRRLRTLQRAARPHAGGVVPLHDADAPASSIGNRAEQDAANARSSGRRIRSFVAHGDDADRAI